MLDLPQDLIGTNPKYPKIVNHDWLTPDPKTYDNFPSDNNPVRVVPKLADLWNHESTGINLVPNLTVQSLGSKQADEKNEEVVSSVLREAKKAMMVGLKGKDLAGHLRARFAAQDICMAKEALEKLSEEQGLLGNVYIDASAFSSVREAEKFLEQHKNRLAQDIVINQSKITPDVIKVLANRYRKNVIASVSYDEATFKKYKTHLVASGKIGKDYAIDSKETLREAFLAVPSKEPAVVAKKEEKIDTAEMFKGLAQKNQKEADDNRSAEEEMKFRKALPIITFAREQTSKGKTGAALKEMLLNKYARVDLNDSAKYIAMVVGPHLSSDTIDQMVTASTMTKYIASNLKDLVKKFPLHERIAEERKPERQIGVKGFFHTLSGGKVSDDLDCYREASAEALRKGIDLDRIKAKLAKTLPEGVADRILSDAMVSFNATSAGVKANVQQKKAKENLYPDLPEKATLPDPTTIKAQAEDIISFYDGAGTDIDVDVAPSKIGNMDISDLFNRSGMDSAL